MIHWTPSLDDSMRTAIASGLSYGQFAASMGMTRSTALSRALRLRRAGVVGFDLRSPSSRPEPAPKPAKPPKPPKPAAAKAYVSKDVRVPKPKAKADFQPESDRLSGLPLWDQISPDRVGMGKAFIDLRSGDCRWLAASGLYCGHTVHARSYCPFHHGVVYVASRKTLNVRQFQRYASVPARGGMSHGQEI